jgi:hypothetical protein
MKECKRKHESHQRPERGGKLAAASGQSPCITDRAESIPLALHPFSLTHSR